MKNILNCLFLLVAIYPAYSQSKSARTGKDKGQIFTPVKETVETCFTSDRLQKLIPKQGVMTEADFNTLTPREKFIFAYEHPESYSQICVFFVDTNAEAHLHANFPMPTVSSRMSARQAESLETNRDSTIAYLRECLQNKKKIPTPYKKTIAALNAYELIPEILQIQKTGEKDTYLYTLLMQLMKDKFPYFYKSELYTRLYANGKSYRQTIPITPERVIHIVDLSKQYYQYKTGQTESLRL